MRVLVIVAFWAVTILVCGQAIFRNSVTKGIAAFVACAMCYWGASGFAGSFISRRDDNGGFFDLADFGVVCALLVVAGVVLIVWSDFSINVFGSHIPVCLGRC